VARTRRDAECAPFNLTETKDQQRPRRQDHKNDEANEKIKPARAEVRDGKIGGDRPQRQ
jgi:hypothetical protein